MKLLALTHRKPYVSRRIASLVVVAAIGYTASGCSHGTAPGVDAEPSSIDHIDYPKATDIPLVDDGDIPVLPIEAYLVKQEERDRIIKASRIVVGRCMARFGFDMAPSTAQNYSFGPDATTANRARRYGLSDATTAAEYGYHLPGLDETEPSEEEPDDRMSNARRRVFLGDSDQFKEVEQGGSHKGKKIPEGGCSGEAKRMVGDGLTQQTAQEINASGYELSLADRQVKEVFERWSVCMEKRGYRFTSPMHPFREIRRDEPDAPEVSMAKADVTCKYQVNLLGVWHAVESQIQKVMIGKREETLQTAREETGKSLKNAARIIAEETG